jgi:RNA polymerase sigma-70 factor (ECF subfamily)
VNAEEIDRLVRRVQTGEQEPFWDLILHVQQDVRLFIAVLSPSTELVEEILQSTFVRAYDGIRKYEPRGLFLQWIKGIARNILREELRARARHLAIAGNAVETMVAEDCLQDVDAREPEPGLQDCIDRLAPHSRELLERRYGANLSLNKLAQQFKKPADSIAVTLCRIRESLRQCLEARGARA